MLNWAIPEVRAEKFALIQELCENYDFAGLELDFLRFYSFFRLNETTREQRCLCFELFFPVSPLRSLSSAPSRERFGRGAIAYPGKSS